MLKYFNFNYNRYIYVLQGLPNFWTRFSNSEKYDIDITQSASAGCQTYTKCQNHGISPRNSRNSGIGHDENNKKISIRRLQSRQNFKIKKKKCPFFVQHSILK